MTLDELKRRTQTLWRLYQLLTPEDDPHPLIGNRYYDAYNRARIDELDAIIKVKQDKESTR